MAFPKQADVEVPLLRVLLKAGGSAKPQDVYPILAAEFPELTAEEQEQRLESTPAVRKWWNLVQWVRQRLVEVGEIDGTTRGIWKLTNDGRKRLNGQKAGRSSKATSRSTSIPEVTLRDLSNRSREEAKRRLLEELKGLSPTGFEHF